MAEHRPSKPRTKFCGSSSVVECLPSKEKVVGSNPICRLYMFYTYILQSEKNNRTYVGFCNNIETRFKRHNASLVKATKFWLLWRIIHSEIFQTVQRAKRREKYWKSGAGRRKLKRFLKEGFPSIQKF